MLLRAAQNLALDLSRSWVIGDAPRDIEAGHAAGCRTVLVTHPHLAASPAAREALKVEPDFTASTLTEAMDVIERHGLHRTVVPPVVPGGAAAKRDEVETEDVGAGRGADLGKVEALLEQILAEVKRSTMIRHHADFSVPHLLAVVVQVFALAVLVLGYFGYFGMSTGTVFLFGLYLQTLVVSLLLFGRQR
jgi:hypothetical protein